MIRFDKVTKLFGRSNALTDLTVEIPSGDFVFLIGPSGAGKTTLLRLILRDLLPTSGSIHVHDIEVNKLSKNKIHLLRRTVGMVFQDFKLLMDRTVYENAAIGLEILGKSKTEVDKRIRDVLHLVGLSDKAHLFPAQLSGGEMQRASIARAIAPGPKVLLADEPTGNLDPKTTWEIIQILEEINKLGTTIIMATHNSSVVNDLQKRTILIENGLIVSDEIKGRYKVSSRKKEQP
jgi:cell division transport system ATP-binding protein